MEDERRAQEALCGHTLALVRGDVCITRDERGIAPLLALIDGKTDVRGFSAADRVVGKAAAFCYIVLGVRSVYAEVISTLAEEVLLGHGIAVEADLRVERIRNRTNDGFCPMESAVETIHDPALAVAAVRTKLAEMRAANNKGKV